MENNKSGRTSTIILSILVCILIVITCFQIVFTSLPYPNEIQIYTTFSVKEEPNYVPPTNYHVEQLSNKKWVAYKYVPTGFLGKQYLLCFCNAGWGFMTGDSASLVNDEYIATFSDSAKAKGALHQAITDPKTF